MEEIEREINSSIRQETTQKQEASAEISSEAQKDALAAADSSFENVAVMDVPKDDQAFTGTKQVAPRTAEQTKRKARLDGRPPLHSTSDAAMTDTVQSEQPFKAVTKQELKRKQ